MGKDSKIEWTHHTFNPWWGCVKIAPECAHCYAATFAKRTGHDVWGPDAPRRFFGDSHWAEPHKWNEQACAAGERHRVFCASMSDVCEDLAELESARTRLKAIIKQTPSLDWLLLTKRPENFLPMFGADFFKQHRNVWVGTTAGTQATANKNIPHLRRVPAAVRFVSVEPLLEAVNFSEWIDCNCPADYAQFAGDDAHNIWCPRSRVPIFGKLDWVIIGGESGANARPMHWDWAASIQQQCAQADIAFFFKQWGEWLRKPLQDWKETQVFKFPNGDRMFRHGAIAKKHLPEEQRKLIGSDGIARTWSEFPKVGV